MIKIVPVDQIPKEIQAAPEDKFIDLYKLFLEMENLCLLEKGIGLSAVQVGVPWKIFVIRTDLFKKDRIGTPTFRHLVNCEYEPADDSKKSLSVEGCLSLKDAQGRLRSFRVERWDRIKVKGKELLSYPELKLAEVDEVLDKGQGIVWQHEIDHHRGKLISDPGFGTEVEIW